MRLRARSTVRHRQGTFHQCCTAARPFLVPPTADPCCSRCVVRLQPTQYSSSVEIGADWQVMEQISTTSLSRLHYSPGEPEDLLACGSLEYYDKVGGDVGTGDVRCNSGRA